MSLKGSNPAGHTIENYATIEAHCGDVPVYAFGYMYVHGESPDIDPDIRFQKNNDERWEKLKLKKSWEIKNCKIGAFPGREPKTAANDDQPLLCVHLIDGDPKTSWCSRGQAQPDVEPVWIRVDLPVETEIESIRLMPLQGSSLSQDPIHGSGGEGKVPLGQAFPKKLAIKTSRDAWHWDIVHESAHFHVSDPTQPVVFSFQPRPVKQVWIIGECFPRVLNFGHCFSISGVEVTDGKGRNAALISRGAGVTVSSTHTGFGMDRYTQDMLWPIQYDIGYTWTRVGCDMGVFTWPYVERVKGVLKVDPRADMAITEAVHNGMNVIICLDKGNWLYAPNPKKKDRTRELMELYYDKPPIPNVSPEYLEGYLSYVRYMVRHFKDRVKYFEIWNEWHVHESTGTLKQYCDLAKRAIRVIRDEYPGARIMAVSAAGWKDSVWSFIEGYLKEGLGPLIDVISWHPFYQRDPENDLFINYARDVRELKKMCESYGFKGEYMATEYAYSDAYPPTISDIHVLLKRTLFVTELEKAKIAALVTVKHVGLDMVTLWCETFQTQEVQWSIGLNRNPFTADPIPPVQTEAIYYVQRTLCTVLDDVKPLEIPIEYSNKNGTYETMAFQKGKSILVSVWLPGRIRDRSVGVETDVILPGRRAKDAYVIDIINGRKKRLRFSVDGGATVLDGILVHDFPVVLEIEA